MSYWWLLAVFGILAPYALHHRWIEGHRRKLLQAVATELTGLERSRFRDSAFLAGEVEGRAVKIGASDVQQSFFSRPEMIEVEVDGLPDSAQVMGAKYYYGVGSLIRKPWRSGDPALDAKCRLYGAPDQWLARLDAETRSQLAEIFGRDHVDVMVRRGRVSARMPAREVGRGGSKYSSAPELVATTRLLVSIARRFSIEPGQIPARLLERVRSDPVSEVRNSAFRALLGRHRRSPEATQAAELVLETGEAELMDLARSHLRSLPLRGGQLALSSDASGGELSGAESGGLSEPKPE